MGITSLQVCMDSNDWLQGAISEDGTGMDSSSPITTPTTGDEMLTCSRPLIERRLRPQHEQSLKCPRCESTHTKFCYYNNYSLSQPRYFCKTCRRYWTKGGTLRNIPVGGGCRKNKKVSSKKSSPSDQSPSSSSVLPNMSSHSPLSSYNNHANATDLHLAFPEQIQFSHLHASALYGTGPYNLLDTPAPIDFMENKYEALLGTHDSFIGGGENYGGSSIMQPPPLSAASFHGGAYFDQRLMLPYQHQHDQNGNFNQNRDDVEVKPNGKVLSLEWHDHQQACNSDGYNFGGLGSWAGLMNGYGPSATNPLV